MVNKIPKPWILILTVGLGVLLNPLNSSMVSVALTRVQLDFDLSFADASWMISVFYLASAVGQPVMGKLSDMFGTKRLFISGLILVSVSCALAPFSPNYGFLLGCRALQAIGSSTLFPSGMIMIRSYITEKQARAIGIVTIFASSSAAFGPSIGGFLVGSWSWPAIFIVNFPFIVIALGLAIFILPKNEHMQANLKRLDFIGIIYFVISIIGLILFLLSLEQNINWIALIFFIVAGGLFYTYEQKLDDPFINVSHLKTNKNITLVYGQYILVNLVYYNFFFGLPSFLQQVRGYSEEQTGLIMLTLAGFGVLVTPLAGRIIDKQGSKLPLVIGAFCLLLGTGLLITYHETSPLVWLIFIMAVLGVSNGFTNISAQTALYEHVEPEETGSASGLFQTSRYLGSILSGSFLGLTFNRHISDAQLHLVAIVCFFLCIVIVGLSFMLPGSLRSKKVKKEF